MLQQDGEECRLIDLDGNRVVVALRGLCTSCPSSALTKSGIEDKLKGAWCIPISMRRR